MSASRSVKRCAARGSVSVRYESAFSALNRKCGCTCAWSARSSARVAASRSSTARRSAAARCSCSAQVLEPQPRLHEQVVDRAVRVLGQLLARRQPRRPRLGPLELHLPPEPAGQRRLDRGARVVAVQRLQQLVAGLIECRAQRHRIAAEQPVEPALQPLAQRREHERHHQGRHHVDDQRLLAGHRREQPLAHEHDGDVDRRHHARQQRVGKSALEQSPRVEHRIAGDQERHDERREQQCRSSPP